MSKVLRTFISAEEGAVTVEWAVVTAAVVGLGLAIVAGVRSGVLNLKASIIDVLTTWTF